LSPAAELDEPTLASFGQEAKVSNKESRAVSFQGHRISFAPETTELKRNGRGQSQTKIQENQRRRSLSPRS
jgi:hypothetical protein